MFAIQNQITGQILCNQEFKYLVFTDKFTANVYIKFHNYNNKSFKIIEIDKTRYGV